MIANFFARYVLKLNALPGRYLSMQIPENVPVAVGAGVDAVPTLERCAAVLAAQNGFRQLLDWMGKGKDEEREVKSPNLGFRI